MDKNSLSILSFAEVTKTQETLVRTNLRIKTLIEAFADCMTNEDMENLNAEIREELESMRNSVATLRKLSVIQRDPEAKSMLFNDVANHERQISSSAMAFKAANLRCIQELERKSKEELFRGRDGSGSGSSRSSSELDNLLLRRRRKVSDRDGFVKESSHVTDKLSAISRQLAATVERSSLTIAELTESSTTVEETNEEFKGFSAVIGQSRKLITKYGRRETTDRVLIVFAIAFFFACVFYVLRKRVLGPLDPFVLIWTLITSFLRLFGIEL